jgi:hypothetical protein
VTTSGHQGQPETSRYNRSLQTHTISNHNQAQIAANHSHPQITSHSKSNYHNHPQPCSPHSYNNRATNTIQDYYPVYNQSGQQTEETLAVRLPRRINSGQREWNNEVYRANQETSCRRNDATPTTSFRCLKHCVILSFKPVHLTTVADLVSPSTVSYILEY